MYDLTHQRPADAALTRLRPFKRETTALLLVDLQNAEITPDHQSAYPYYWDTLHSRVLPHVQRLLKSARAAGVEVLYTVIESLTRDGRDRGLDHKLSGIHVPAGSPQGRVIDTIAPADDEIVLRKTSSGVFNSTMLDYLLRNLGIESVIIAGVLTDQCVDMAVRDGADRGYYMVCAADACTTHTEQRHQDALRAFGGYCRQMSTDEIVTVFDTLEGVMHFY